MEEEEPPMEQEGSDAEEDVSLEALAGELEADGALLASAGDEDALEGEEEVGEDEAGGPPEGDDEGAGELLLGEEGGLDGEAPGADEPDLEEELDDAEKEAAEAGDSLESMLASAAAEDAGEAEAADADVEIEEGEALANSEGADLDDEAADVPEHLQDAVEGSLRLKRMLSMDKESESNSMKRRRKLDPDEPRPIIQAKVRQVMAKYQSTGDLVMKYILDQSSVEELQYLLSGSFFPNKFDQRKTAAELTGAHLIQQRERKLGGGSRIDVISAFKLRWSLAMDCEKSLRGLSHRELRYVIANYDGSSPLQDVVQEAAALPPVDGKGEEDTAEEAAPTRPGIKVMSRFNRLELIDPLADCAVFGDANLTFSINLAKHRKDFGHVGRVIATTFEEVETLRERYKEIDESIKELEEFHAEVYHGVDCTRVALDPRFDGLEGKLGAVYYNFPHSGAIQGFFDSNPMVNWRHENLMRLFFRALRSFVKPGGIVKVASNSGAVGVRYSYIVGGAIENEFLHTETMPFLEWHLHRYGRSYGDRRDVYRRPDAKNNQSYNAQNANADMVYCFSYAPSGANIGKQPIRLPPSLKVLSYCQDGPFKNMPPNSAGRAHIASQLHERFLKEVSGTHVG